MTEQIKKMIQRSVKMRVSGYIAVKQRMNGTCLTVLFMVHLLFLPSLSFAQKGDSSKSNIPLKKMSLEELSMSSSDNQSTPTPEYQLKAVFLFNFTQFVEWAPGSFATEQSPLIIGVLGENPFGSYLSDVVSGEKVNGHPIVVQHFSNYEDIKNCHILFIANNETNKIGQITARLKKHNILTVSDAPNFLSQGGMIRFFIKNKKIQFQINLDVAKEDNLLISSKLLRLADIYVPIKNN